MDARPRGLISLGVRLSRGHVVLGTILLGASGASVGFVLGYVGYGNGSLIRGVVLAAALGIAFAAVGVRTGLSTRRHTSTKKSDSNFMS